MPSSSSAATVADGVVVAGGAIASSALIACPGVPSVSWSYGPASV
jgi:hypothetical protein